MVSLTVKIWTTLEITNTITNMEFNPEKLASIAKPRSEAAIERARFRKENREWLRMSQEIALCLHYYLRTADITQKELADKMGVSAVYVGKLLKGGENLTLETICKIQKAISEEIVNVAKPYINTLSVSFVAQPKISTNVITSDSFSDKQSTQDSYVSTMGISVA